MSTNGITLTELALLICLPTIVTIDSLVTIDDNYPHLNLLSMTIASIVRCIGEMPGREVVFS